MLLHSDTLSLFRVDMLLHSDTLSLFRVDMLLHSHIISIPSKHVFALTPLYCVFSIESINTTFYIL